MPLPVRTLPVIQHWDCHGCTDCCREYRVHITEAEKTAIEQQGWAVDPAFAGVPLFVRERRGRRGRWRLNHRPDGSCVFLDSAGRCRIHDKFGSAAKPLACRIFPFVLVPAGDHWRVGIRFACPSATANLGRPLSAHVGEAQTYANLVEEREFITGLDVPPPPLQAGQRVPWADVFLFLQALKSLVNRHDEPFERRLRLCLALDAFCRQAKFDKISGRRLTEFLNLIAGELDRATPVLASELPRPSWAGRMLFRQMLALYARRDTGRHKGVAVRSPFARIAAAWRFARGSGRVPRVHALLPAITFEEMEQPAGPLTPGAVALLERYYTVKIESMQFAGPSNFRFAFWEGLESLVMTFPAIMWLSRAFRDMSRDDAVRQAVQIADDNFGFHPLLGSARQRVALRILGFRGDLARLVAWYGR
jgi:lysine-N-methylase